VRGLEPALPLRRMDVRRRREEEGGREEGEGVRIAGASSILG
jgi:hypothetical protein